MIIFSFSLFGTHAMYNRGMIDNATILAARFPEARVQIYIADDVPTDTAWTLSTIPTVRLIPVRNKGIQNTFDRFLAIDDPDCSIMFVRDADSRVHARDIACIEDFIQSDKLLHIIRDHAWHGGTPILAGLWGIRKAAMKGAMAANINRWLKRRQIPFAVYKGPAASVLGMQGPPVKLPKQCDQQFLRNVLYPRLKENALVHDRIGSMEGEVRTPFRVPIEDRLFCGQVHRYDASGNEFTEFDP
jgi:hypothetical protein